MKYSDLSIMFENDHMLHVIPKYLSLKRED